MTSGRALAMLSVLGVTEIEDAVYSELVGIASATAARLASALGVQRAAIESALAGLMSRGLVTCTPTRPPRFVAAPPDIVVESMLLRQQAELNDARGELEHLVKAYRSGRRTRNPAELVEIVCGAEHVAERLRYHQHSARWEFIAFVKPPFMIVDIEHAPILDDPGVTYRTIYDQAMLDDPRFGPRLRTAKTAGRIHRLHPSLPMKLLIADRETALLPLGRDNADTTPAVVVVYSSGLVDALVALFEHYWEGSTPLLLSGDGADRGLEQVDRRILALLVCGVTNETIARQLDMTLRTVRRRVQAMMQAANAQNRAQLGWQAARGNWL